MKNSTIGKRYAKSLFEIAKEKEKVDVIQNDLLILKEAILSEKLFDKFLDSKIIAQKDKIEFINNVFDEKVSEEVISFIVFLLNKKRETELYTIFDEYQKIANEYTGIAIIDGYSAVEVSNEEKEKLTQKLSEALNKKIKISINIDENLLGGLKIKHKDQVIDGSIINKLDQYKKVLMK